MKNLTGSSKKKKALQSTQNLFTFSRTMPLLCTQCTTMCTVKNASARVPYGAPCLIIRSCSPRLHSITKTKKCLKVKNFDYLSDIKSDTETWL